MKRQRNCSQLKEQEKALEKIMKQKNNLPDKELKALVIRMLGKNLQPGYSTQKDYHLESKER